MKAGDDILNLICHSWHSLTDSSMHSIFLNLHIYAEKTEYISVFFVMGCKMTGLRREMFTGMICLNSVAIDC